MNTAREATALEPVRAEMLRQAAAEAEAVVAGAEADAAARVAAASTEAAAILAEAQARGAADARQALRAGAARGRREARAIELRARRQIYESWHAAVFAGVRRLKQDPGYPALLARQAEQVRAVLGTDAVIEEAPSGGLRARSRGRMADLTLDAAAARAVERAEGEEGELWTA